VQVPDAVKAQLRLAKRLTKTWVLVANRLVLQASVLAVRSVPSIAIVGDHSLLFNLLS
jgi:hypothetical protein